jgi:hypothetical protein
MYMDDMSTFPLKYPSIGLTYLQIYLPKYFKSYMFCKHHPLPSLTPHPSTKQPHPPPSSNHHESDY